MCVGWIKTDAATDAAPGEHLRFHVRRMTALGSHKENPKTTLGSSDLRPPAQANGRGDLKCALGEEG